MPWFFRLFQGVVNVTFAITFSCFFNVFSCPTATSNCSLAWKAFNLQGRLSQRLFQPKITTGKLTQQPVKNAPRNILQGEDVGILNQTTTSVFCWFLAQLFHVLKHQICLHCSLSRLAFFETIWQIFSSSVKTTWVVFKISF